VTYALIPGAGGSARYWKRVAPMVASRVPTASMVLVNPMVPVAGESPGKWWGATGHDRVVRAFDPVEDFFQPSRVH